MVRRAHVVQGSFACCPWWTLGGGALVAAAAVTLSGGPGRVAAGAELERAADRGVECIAPEDEAPDRARADEARPVAPRKLGPPHPSGRDTTRAALEGRAPLEGDGVDAALRRRASETATPTGPGHVPDAR